jgi:signal transduction histidine kinase/PAS domain-containing protein/ActR/RegA family two-component response regulator
MIFKTPSTIRFQSACLVAASVLPIWLVSFFLLFQAYSEKREQVTVAMSSTARSLTMVVDKELGNIQAALLGLATSPSFTTGDFQSVHGQALQLLKTYPGADIIVADASGQQLVNSFRPYGTVLPKRKDPETVRRIFETGRPVISDLFFGALTKRPLVGVDVPVFVDGKVAYDLAMTIPASQISSILLNQKLPAHWYSSVLDSKYFLVARSVNQQKYQGKRPRTKLIEAIKLATEGLVEGANLEGTPVFVTFCRSTMSDWTVLVGTPRVSIMSGINRWFFWTALGLIAISLLWGFLVATFAQRIVQAIQSLVGPARAIGRGEIVQAGENHAIVETGEVAVALAQASELLQERNKELKESERRYAALFANRLNPIAHCRVVTDQLGQPVDYLILKVNEAYERTIGIKKADIEGRTAREVFPGVEIYGFDYIGELGRIALEGSEGQFEAFFEATRQHFSIYAYSPTPGEFTAILTNVTRQKRVDTFKDMNREILQILSGTADFREQIRQILARLKEGTGFDAVGIRLQVQRDFPFFEQVGFSKYFLSRENTLIGQAEDGAVHGDLECGTLACACGMVLSAKTDPASPLCTPGGSFWTNDLACALDLLSAQQLRFQPRNVCLQQGYASVALVPIRDNNRILGLLQFNDAVKERLDLETVQLMEDIASHLAAALVRKQGLEEKIHLENQLQHAMKMESVGRLAGGVAHDFNNMLGVILGHANLVLMDLAEDHQNFVNVKEISRAAERSANLTRQLLAFARKQPIMPKVVNLNETLAAMLDMLKRVVGTEIDLDWQPEQDLWPVNVDPSQLDQILVNLCLNARDAIEGVGRISIGVANCIIDEEYGTDYRSVIAGEYVRLTVSDTGCGMDEETLALIFEPFFTTKGTGKGTGLGLATVYGAVKQNGGFIYAHSEPGLGTTFSIFLPRYCGDVLLARQDGPHGSSQRGHETILLVEDEPAILNVAKMILTRQGYHVLAADSPALAIRLAAEHGNQISLLLTDVIMPEMNGRDLAQILSSSYPHIKRLFMSGFTADIIARQGIIDERLHFIQKPFSVHTLSLKVREVLDADGGA